MNFFNKILSLTFFLICVGLGLASLYFSYNLENIEKNPEIFLSSDEWSNAITACNGSTNLANCICDTIGTGICSPVGSKYCIPNTTQSKTCVSNPWDGSWGCWDHPVDDSSCAPTNSNDCDPACSENQVCCDGSCYTDWMDANDCNVIYGCETCDGSCDQNGCNVSCDGVNPHDDCGIWPGTWICEGFTDAGCNENLGLIDEGDLSLGYDYDFSNSDYWCKSIQNDSNASNGACSAVYIGDRGEWCYANCTDLQSFRCWDGTTVSGSEIGTKLDWNCTPEEPPTGTVSAVCEPATQTYFSNLEDSRLAYKVTVDVDAGGSTELAESNIWIEFKLADGGEDLRDLLVAYLGEPWLKASDWSWYIYGIGQDDGHYEEYTNSAEEIIEFIFADADHPDLSSNPAVYIHGASQQISIDDFALQTKQWIDDSTISYYSSADSDGDGFPDSATYTIAASATKVGGIKNDVLGRAQAIIYPNACATPPEIAYACESLDGNPIELEIGEVISLTCTASGDDASYAWFRIVDSDGNLIDTAIDDAAQALSGDPLIAETTYTIPSDMEFGSYFAHCRVCTDDNSSQDNCTPWGLAE